MDELRSKEMTNLSRSLPCLLRTPSRTSTPSICHKMNKSHDGVIPSSNMAADWKTGMQNVAEENPTVLNDYPTNAMRDAPQLFRNIVDTSFTTNENIIHFQHRICMKISSHEVMLSVSCWQMDAASPQHTETPTPLTGRYAM